LFTKTCYLSEDILVELIKSKLRVHNFSLIIIGDVIGKRFSLVIQFLGLDKSGIRYYNYLWWVGVRKLNYFFFYFNLTD
jgi:hypothetical protein